MRVTKKTVIATFAAAGAATGIAIGAGASSGATSPTSSSTDGPDAPQFTSSITAPDTETEGAKTDEATHEADDAAEQAALLPLAKIDAGAAKAAALAAVPGIADSVELNNEDGNVVWTVQVTDSAGLKTTVFVDAGNATVLLTKAHDHENDGADGPDAAETGGSGD